MRNRNPISIGHSLATASVLLGFAAIPAFASDACTIGDGELQRPEPAPLG